MYAFSSCPATSGSPLIDTSSGEVIGTLVKGKETCGGLGDSSKGYTYFAQLLTSPSTGGDGIDPRPLIEELPVQPGQG